MAFRVGQCHYKDEKYTDAALAFDDFVKRFPDAELCSEALFEWRKLPDGQEDSLGLSTVQPMPLGFRRAMRPSIPAVVWPCPKC